MQAKRSLLLLAAAVLATACSSGRAAPTEEVEAPAPSLPSGVFKTVERISLEENEEVMNVWPAVFVQDDRGFFLVDQQEARARFYRPDGSLVRQFGRRGRGPGEFQRPINAFRLASGRSVVADLRSGLLVFDDRDSLLSSVVPPLTPLYGMLPVSDTHTYLFGRPRGWRRESGAPLVHLWNLETQRIERSFFPTPGNAMIQRAAMNFGWAHAARRGDTLAAVFALVDTAYFLDRDGAVFRKLPLPIRDFAPIASFPLRELRDPLRRDRWLRRQYFLASVHWLDDGSLLVQYERPDGVQTRWNLLRVGRDGRRIFDQKDTPKLLAVRDGRLYFQDPQAEAPNQWLVAELAD